MRNKQRNKQIKEINKSKLYKVLRSKKNQLKSIEGVSSKNIEINKIQNEKDRIKRFERKVIRDNLLKQKHI